MIGLLKNLFSRRPAPGDSAIDWRAGDVAVCQNGGTWFRAGTDPVSGPERGEARKVIAVELRPHLFTGAPVQFLCFSAYGPRLFVAAHFTRIDPRADALEKADAAFLASLKPARVPEPQGN